MDTTKHRALFWTSAGAALFTLAVTIGLFWVHDISPLYTKIGGKRGLGPLAENSALRMSTSTVPQEERIVIFFGDNITAGYGLKSLNEAYPALIEQTLHEQGYNVTIINSGVVGDTTTSGVRRAPFIALQKPDVIVLALGSNDALRGIDTATTKANLDSTISIFQDRGIKVILIGAQAPSQLGAQYVSEFNAIYPELSVKHTLPFIPSILKNVSTNPKLMQPDSINPNTAGARAIANTILPVLKRVLGITK